MNDRADDPRVQTFEIDVLPPKRQRLFGPKTGALRHHHHGAQDKRCVLLIDEIDKVDCAFEAMLLELLSVWTLSIPKLGTVRATSIPHVFLTSNQERRLGDPLRRRSLYLIVEHPNAEREAAIVAERTPKASGATHRFIAGLAKSLRAYTLEKPPSISEMNDVAMAMELMRIDRILRLLMKESFESNVRMAGKRAEQIAKEDVCESEVVVTGREIQK
jgi:MoxR-like ATPase